MNMRKWGWVFAVPVVILPAVYFWGNFHAHRKDTVEPSKAEVAQKVLKLQAPFIANDGQTDEKVRFYAKTFGGTVFVTKEGAIVYALPNNSSELGVGSLRSDVRSQRLEDGRQEAGGRRQKPEYILLSINFLFFMHVFQNTQL